MIFSKFLLAILVTAASATVSPIGEEFYLKETLNMPREYRRGYNELRLAPSLPLDATTWGVIGYKKEDDAVLYRVFIDPDGGYLIWQRGADGEKWGTHLPACTDGQLWMPVELVMGNGDAGFSLETVPDVGQRLTTSNPAFTNWMICDGNRGKAQLFWRCTSDLNLPRCCGNVNIWHQGITPEPPVTPPLGRRVA
ncbi:hypothetical protein Dda_9379 [Drechslerella dactyloides]|uniref:DUF7907 domain-containing protein n=1 Tax=Drechslerella dactyloides TaxID=74499 RepID=A0AAD6IPF3_DREDA|nr:hypothetical protein Dda_9379 [Drechslerella dactyloides]